MTTKITAAWDTASFLAIMVAALERRIQQLQTQKYNIIGKQTIGCYGRDLEGNPWSTFQIHNGSTVCHNCGSTIDRGWSRGRIGEEQIHVCSDHVIVNWEHKG